MENSRVCWPVAEGSGSSESGRATLPLVYCFDENYLRYAAVAATSALKHSSSPLRIYWLFPKELLARVRAAAAPLEQFVDLRLVPADLRQFADWKTGYHFTAGNYLRLLIPDLIGEARAIYLDCDTLVLADLGPLYATDLNGCVFAGVADRAGEETTRVPRAPDDAYINSGVLLMDLDLLRKENLRGRAAEIYREFESQIEWPDQDVLNKFGEGRKLLLDPRWNCQVFLTVHKTSRVVKYLRAGAIAVLHFVGTVKPWHAGNDDRLNQLWLSYEDTLQSLEQRAATRR